MALAETQCRVIEGWLPRLSHKVSRSDRPIRNAMLYIAKQGCNGQARLVLRFRAWR